MLEIIIGFAGGLTIGSLSVYLVMNRNTQTSSGEKSPNVVSSGNVDYKAE